MVLFPTEVLPGKGGSGGVDVSYLRRSLQRAFTLFLLLGLLGTFVKGNRADHAAVAS